MYYKKIEGENLYLSPMCVDDTPKYVKLMNDSKVTNGLNSSKKVTTLESEIEWIEKNNKDGNFTFAIVRKDNDELIGNCGFNEIETLGTVGIFIGEADNRGKAMEVKS